MIALAALLVLVAVALLVGGLGNGDTTLLWASVGVSALAAVVLVVQTLQRSRAARERAAGETAPAADRPVQAARAAQAARASSGSGTASVAAAAPGRTAGTPAGTTAVVDDEPPGATAAGAGAVSPRAGGASTDADPGSTDADPGSTDADPGSPADAEVETEGAAASSAAAADPPPSNPSAARPVGLSGPVGADGEPPEEEVEVTDLLLVLDLTDEVVVVDEHPRYHLAGCAQTAGQEEIPLPLDEAREDGFTACGVCGPDSHLAERERERRAAARG